MPTDRRPLRRWGWALLLAWALTGCSTASPEPSASATPQTGPKLSIIHGLALLPDGERCPEGVTVISSPDYAMPEIAQGVLDGAFSWQAPGPGQYQVGVTCGEHRGSETIEVEDTDAHLLVHLH